MPEARAHHRKALRNVGLGGDLWPLALHVVKQESLYTMPEARAHHRKALRNVGLGGDLGKVFYANLVLSSFKTHVPVWIVKDVRWGRTRAELRFP